eukprot:CAMPEP_0117675342 /NCGR_PEP_ID=MMETSP0804-20121206/15550_1 /TAXON_ID=1074897 /ORGANISM="Tetraselmis astigmatica, Strain CCMP880" /LENGTH=66 /DNA_ID=CAMNT_0005484331 /DNA_START=66 /DNA_END=263 /DNA_ORIENTATION=+
MGALLHHFTIRSARLRRQLASSGSSGCPICYRGSNTNEEKGGPKAQAPQRTTLAGIAAPPSLPPSL